MSKAVTGIKSNPNYVKCGHRRAWLMWDMDNGHSQNNRDTGKGYVWVFSSYKEAMAHRKEQHTRPFNARLSMPFKVEGKR